MRIIHLSYAVPKPQYTDPEAWLKRIAFAAGVLESMAKYATVVGVYHIECKRILQRNGVDYHFTGLSKWRLLFPVRFNTYVKKLQPDVVIVHGLIFPLQVLMLRWVIGPSVKIICQHHAERPFTDIRRLFQWWADQYIAAYLFGSYHLGKLWVDKGQIGTTKKIREIMGTSSIFYPMDKTNARLGTKVKGETIYLWVGGLDTNKNPFLVMRAFIRFSQQHPEVKLYMIYQTDELEEQLRGELDRAGRAGVQVHLVGTVVHSQMQEWFNSADFIISSSNYEGSGIAVCEAMSCGCIPILTNIPSFRMMTDNGKVGLLYQTGNTDDLVAALEKGLSMNLATERRRVLERFNDELSFEANARKIIAVVNE